MSKETSKIIPATGSIMYVDVGNSSIKVAAYVGEGWRILERIAHGKISELIDRINTNSGRFELLVISSVVEKAAKEIAEHIRELNCLLLKTEDIPDELLDYETPATLGVDRYLACYGAVALQHKPVVVIDAGTACTIDYMSGDCVFRGGVIMPGISALERAMKIHAPALPEVARTIPAEWPGKSTEASLQWGITATFMDGIHAGLKRYENTFGSFDLVLTGGDAEWLAALIRRDFSVEPMLVFGGMRHFVEDYKRGK